MARADGLVSLAGADPAGAAPLLTAAAWNQDSVAEAPGQADLVLDAPATEGSGVLPDGGAALGQEAAFQDLSDFDLEATLGLFGADTEADNPAVAVLRWLEDVVFGMLESLNQAVQASAAPAAACEDNVGLALDAFWHGAYDSAKDSALTGAGDCATSVVRFFEGLFY